MKPHVIFKRTLMIDIGRCSKCMGCVEALPEVFRYNPDSGIVEVVDLDEYPEDEVREVIKNCPKDCIWWE